MSFLINKTKKDISFCLQKLSLNRTIWMFLILSALANMFLNSPFHIGTTQVPVSLFFVYGAGFLFLGILAKKGKLFFSLTKADYFLFGFFLINIFSVFINIYRFGIDEHNINGLLFILSGIVYFFILRILIQNQRQVILLFKIYFFTACIPALFSIFNFIIWKLGISYALPWHIFISKTGNFRATGFAREPSNFALYLCSVLMIGLYFCFRRQERRKIFYFLALAIISLGLLLTLSRFIAVIPFFIIWFFGVGFRKKQRKIIPVLIFLMILASIIFVSYNLNRDMYREIFFKTSKAIESLQDKDSALSSRRLKSMLIGWDIFKESPIIGIGANNLSREVMFEFSGMNLDVKRNAIHSKFILILVRTGIFGFLFFLLFILSAVVKKLNFKEFFLLPRSLTFSFFVLAFCQGILKGHTLFPFWFLAALSVNYNLYFKK